MIRALLYNPADDSIVQTNLDSIRKWDHQGDKRIWIDIENIDQQTADLIQPNLYLHPLAVESCFNEEAFPKVEIYKKSCFVVFDAINFNPGYRALDLINLYCFLGRNFLVTVHAEPLRSINELYDKLTKEPKAFKEGLDYILYELLDSVVNRYFPIIDQFEEKITSLEDRIFEHFDDVGLQEIFRLKKELISLRRSTNPQRDILSELSSKEMSFISPKVRTYFRDVFHHVWRIADTIDTYRDVITGALESYMTILSNRMNQVMKTLSVVATIMLPLTVLTGIFGMNFVYIPGLEYRVGFFVFMLAILIVIIIMWIYFKRKKWM
ncbi:MAG: magnesium/cobalt transporter CorA [candidate division Zixibacteria bacterium]|nr:magnesium/cobalt transporter CorA [candidate division Zixibacteria bacterium]